MQGNKLFTYVGFAVKSGKIRYGVDEITACKRPPAAVLVSETLSENSLAKLDRYLAAHASARYTVDLGTLLPEKNCKAIGITDPHLAEAVKSELKENRI